MAAKFVTGDLVKFNSQHEPHVTSHYPNLVLTVVGVQPVHKTFRKRVGSSQLVSVMCNGLHMPLTMSGAYFKKH